MDRQLRELERLAAQGDVQALAALKKLLIRNQAIPSDEDIELMGCGFAVGDFATFPLFINIWTHIFNELLNSCEEVVGLISQEEIDPFPFDLSIVNRGSIHAARSFVRQAARTYSQASPGPDLIPELADDWRQVVEFLNVFLEGNDKTTLYFNLNEVTQSLSIGFVGEGYDTYRHDIPVYQEFDNRPYLYEPPEVPLYLFVPKISTTLRWRDGEIETNFEWNVGNSTYIGSDRETLCDIDFFQNLPCVLQEFPWKQWGYGQCDDTNRDPPLVRELGTMHWLKL